MTRIPALLILVRALCGPALLVADRLGASGAALAGLLSAAFLSDVFDGMIARRLGVATPGLRRADTIVDAVFYAFAAWVVWRRTPAAIQDNLPGVLAIVGLELSRFFLERWKFGRLASYHMWSAKAWGIALWLGFSEVFLAGAAGPLFRVAVAVGVIADLEGLAATLVLSTWQHDIRSLWHAMALERRQVP